MWHIVSIAKKLKNVIRSFRKDNYSGLEMRVKEVHELLLSSQAQTLADPSIPNAETELEAQRKWLILLRAEESFLLQRSRVQCLSLGDANTYFHRMINMRRAQNHNMYYSFLFVIK